MSLPPAFNLVGSAPVHRKVVQPRASFGSLLLPGHLPLILVVMLGWSGPMACGAVAVASEKPRVAFGGFAFAGAASGNAQRYPLLSAINGPTDDGTPLLARLARESLAAQRGAFVHVELAPGLVRRQDEPLVLALAATCEFVQQERITAGQKLVVTLGFDLVLLNFDSFEILSSQPFLLEFVHVGRGAREPFALAAIAELVTTPLLQAANSELRQALATRIPLVAVRERHRANLRVNPVVVAPEAIPHLPPGFRDDVPAYAELVGQIYTAMLAKFAGVAVLPHTKDQLNASMALSFVDGSVIQFRIPEPSYGANLRVRGFRKVRFDETAAEIGWVFGTSLDVSVEIASDQPDLRMTLFTREAVKGIVRDKVPALQQEVDEAMPFFEAVIDGIGTAIGEMKKDKKAREGFLKLCKT